MPDRRTIGLEMWLRRAARCAVAAAACAVASGCSTASVPDRASPASPPAQASPSTLLIRGGSVVRRVGPTARLDLLLLRNEGWFRLAAASVDGGVLQAADTLDVSGMFIHSTHAFLPEVDTTPSERNFAMYAVRTGPSPGSPAVWRLDRDVRRVEPAENHPPGPVDGAAGCYALERGAWSDERFEWDPRSDTVWFPDRLRLHWQYQWRVGASPYLVATDGDGRVGGDIVVHGWRTLPRDSLEVNFAAGWVGTRFRGAREPGGYAGELTVWWDDGGSVRAPAELTRRDCAAGAG